jgi:hypothetical protein
MEAQQKYPKDFVNQMDYILEHASNSYVKLLGVAEIMQAVGSNPHYGSKEITLKALEWYNRVIIDLAKHTENKLDNGIYTYNLNNIRNVSNSILKDIADNQ